MDLPNLLKQRTDVLIDFLVQEFRLQTEQLKHWYCFVRMCMEQLRFSYSLFLHIELLHPTPKIYHKYYSWIKWSFADKADEELVQIF
jgi:hypothetical protein